MCGRRPNQEKYYLSQYKTCLNLFMRIKQLYIKKLPAAVLLLISSLTYAQHNRAQIPALMNNTYFEVNIGYINYPFDASHMESGYNFKSVSIPHTAVRFAVIGYEFNKYLAAQISYMRPVLWVNYTYDAGSVETEATRSVWMNVGGVTIKPQLPVNDKFTIYGEGGMGLITRNGFEDDQGNPVISDANYASFLLGGGIRYNINGNWGLLLSAVYSPENTKVKQPSTTFISGGFRYKLLPLSEEKLERTAKAGYIFPKQMLQIGYVSNILGYGVNNFFAEGTVPVFWGGEAEVARGLTLTYQRNVFHGTKTFSLDWGASMGYFQSNAENQKFFTLSVFPVFRFTFLHSKSADMYFFYSVAGPAFISKNIVDGKDLGEKFTFQDHMGTGVFFGEQRSFNIELKIGHYSNGDIFPGNEGVKIPLALNLGYTFGK
jgi:opacity protein-like surface antigen